MATPRQHIDHIRKSKFAIGGEANPLIEDLHQAVKHLSAELYTKDVHFLMELIQVSTQSFLPFFLVWFLLDACINLYMCYCLSSRLWWIVAMMIVVFSHLSCSVDDGDEVVQFMIFVCFSRKKNEGNNTVTILLRCTCPFWPSFMWISF